MVSKRTKHPSSGVSVYLLYWQDDGDGVVEAGETDPDRYGRLPTPTATIPFTDLPDGDGMDDFFIVSLAAPEDQLNLTTTTSDTPATISTNNLNPAGYTVSAWQALPIPASGVTTNMDFAFVSDTEFDWGDLPVSYSTLRQNLPSGPRHRWTTNLTLYLGSTVDAEPDGQPSVNADGDGADEDGVAITGVWQAGANAGTVVTEVGAGDGWLVGWIDFNGDGDFTDNGGPGLQPGGELHQ